MPGADAGGVMGPSRVVPAKGGGKGAEMPASDTYIVYTQGNDADEVVVRTLIGEYKEQGSNHGRKVYKKLPQKGGEAVDVYLYYWDSRDGPSFEGWWFGNQLGGTQVWSHCTASSLTPPPSGWKIPWDGGVRATLVVMSKTEQQRAESEAKLKEVGGGITEAIGAAKRAHDQAKAAVGDYTNPQGLKTAEELLTPIAPALAEALKKLMESQRGIAGEPARQFQQLMNNLRGAQTAVTTELTKVRASRAKVEQEQKQKVADEKDSVVLQEVMQEATQKTHAAEDSVEKALITSEMIMAGGDDMDEVKQAVSQTEQAAQEAQKSIGEARIYLNAKLASSRRFESERVKQEAATELGKLQTNLQEAQNKLNPLKSVRQDFVNRTAAQKLVQEVLEKLSPAEVDVDRAEEATVMLTGEGLSKEMMQQAEQAVTKAGDHIAVVQKFLEQKKKGASGLALAEIAKMEERTKASQQRLQEFKNAHKEAAERVTCETLLKEAAEKLQTVAETVAKAADAEGPFLMGVEELPLAETLAAIKSCETAATSANTAVSIARMFIATKIVEAKRFSAGPSKEAQAKLKENQAELEAQTKKLTELKRGTALRKKSATMREAEQEVAKAEELARKVGEAASVFDDDAKLFALSSKEIRTASDETIKAEQAANTALAEARKFITGRQIESKGKDMSAEVSAELIKYQTRLSSAQAEVGKFKKLSASVEQRLAAKRVIEEAQAKLKAAEEKVAKVCELVEALGAEEKKPAEGAAAEAEDGEGAATKAEDGGKAAGKDVKSAEHSAAEAQVSLKTVTRFIEMQTRMPGTAKDEISKLQPLVKEAQEKLDAAVATMRERSEKMTVDAIVQESEDRVKEAEDTVKSVVELEAPFQKAEELPIDEASKALTELEAALQGAHTAVGGAKTFLAMKRLAAKRLSEKSMKATAEQLGDLQARVDAVAKKLGDAKKGMNDRKLAVVKREVTEKVVDAEQKVAAATEATKVLGDGSKGDLAPEDMKGACEKAGSTQQEAQSTLTAVRNLLLARQRDAKVAAADSSILMEIGKMLDKLSKIQAELDGQKSRLRDQEHRFVAQRLIKDATDMIAELEKTLETTTEVAAPLASDKEDFTSAVFLGQAIDALKAHLKKGSKTPKALFGELAEGGSLAEGKFVSFCQGLPELAEQKDPLSEEQLRAAYGRLDGKGSGEVKEEDFLDQFVVRYICTAVVSMTESMTVKGGKTIRKLDVNEVVEALGEPAKDDSVGLMRVKCKAEKDEKEGYVTVSGNQGTIYLELYSALTACQKKIEKALQECADSAKEVMKYVEQKCEELKSVRTGPLAETKSDLMKMRPRVSKVQYAHAQLKKKVAESEKRMKERLALERKKRQEAADKKAAAAMMEEVEGLVSASAAAVEGAVPKAEKLASSKGADEESPLKAMDQAERDLEAVTESIEKAQAKIKEHMDAIKTSAKGPFTEARSALVKMKVKVGAMDSKCKKQMVALKAARKQVASDAQAAVKSALRAHALKTGAKVDELFKQLSGGGAEISAQSLRTFVEKIPDANLKAGQLDVGLDCYSAGLTKLAFSGMLQEYHRCVKDIALTTAFEVKDSKTIRKLTVGELVEVLEAGKIEAATGLARVKCRALVDEKEGFVTLRGNQGTDFLERSPKPYYCCEEELTLQKAFETSSDHACTARVGEVLEVLGGPQKEPPVETQRVRGKAGKDGKSGWVTLKDPQGNANLELAKLLVCKRGIVITTTFDISEGKAIRRLEVGETLEILEDPKEDTVRSLLRVRAKAKNDSKEGWVTMKGNQGTAYTEESSSHYICTRSVAMESKFATGSTALRTLEEGEVFEVLDGPKIETKEGATRVKGRALGSGGEGWFTLSAKSVNAWSPQYKCSQGTSMTDGLEIKDAKTVRKLEAGEVLEALETPVLEQSAGIMRVRVRAEKDGLVGFVTVKGNQGTLLLKPMFD